MNSPELHPLCSLFPRMAGAEFDSLVADIKLNGQREPIILHDGMILDGGNRYRACLAAGVEPATMKFGGGNIVAYVLSANLHRRHMTAGQQAAIVASAQDWASAQTHGGNRKKVQTEVLPLDTVASRRAQSGASDKTQRDADKVAKASPELARQVAHGEKSLPKAVEEVTGKRPGAKPPKPVLVSGELTKLREENEALREANAEQGATIKEMLAELATYQADDQLAAAMAENKQLRAQVEVLSFRINGAINETAEAKRAAQSWQRKFERAQKAA